MRLKEGVFNVVPEDFPRMEEVWEAAVRETHHFVSEEDIQIFKPLVRGYLHQAGALACVRDEEDKLAGFFGITGESLDMLFIHPSCRGQGTGRLLVEHAVDILGARTVDVNEQNEQAVGFYLRMGFVVVGRSERDGFGKPYPLLHMRIGTAQDSVLAVFP